MSNQPVRTRGPSGRVQQSGREGVQPEVETGRETFVQYSWSARVQVKGHGGSRNCY